MELGKHIWLILRVLLSIIKCLKRLVYSFTFEAGIVLDSHISEVKN